MYCCNQLSGLSPVTRQHGLSNRGSLLSRQHLFPSMGYCSGNTCESNSLTGEHMCTCYDGLRYLEMGQYLLEECDCADCPMLDMISYGGLIASGFGRWDQWPIDMCKFYCEAQILTWFSQGFRWWLSWWFWWWSLRELRRSGIPLWPWRRSSRTSTTPQTGIRAVKLPEVRSWCCREKAASSCDSLFVKAYN
jgi:hypothetical protein